MTVAIAGTTGRALVPEALFDRLVTHIVKTEDLPPEFAARIMDQALAFLRACADNPGSSLSPSPLVDIGWHCFILHTTDYAEFCDRFAGRFIHHIPTDERTARDDLLAEMARTMKAISTAGLDVDPELWSALALNCNNGDDGCRASGKDGNENTGTNGK